MLMFLDSLESDYSSDSFISFNIFIFNSYY